MTLPDLIEQIKKTEYKYLAFGLVFSEWIPYANEDYPILRQAQKQIPELKIYTDIKKYRLVTKSTNIDK